MTGGDAGGYSLAQELDLMSEAADAAGRVALQYFGKAFEVWDKGQNDPVTEVDLKIDHLLMERLAGARPDYGWLSEEEATIDRPVAAGRCFVVDPIDGTQSFARGHPEFSISIGLLEDGHPVAGVVFAPAREDKIAGAVGLGVTRNGRAAAISTKRDIEGARFVVNYTGRNKKRWNAYLPGASFYAVNSVAYRIALVGCGAFDGTVSAYALSDWDVAAGDAILRAAGARLTDFAGAALVYGQAALRPHPALIAAPEPLARRVRAALADLNPTGRT